MSGILSNVLRANVLKTVPLSVIRQGIAFGTKNSVRTLTHMAKTPVKFTSANSWYKSSMGCSCGCGTRFNHTFDSTAEMLDFLDEEIKSEKEIQKPVSIPRTVMGFDVKYDGAEVTLLKNSNNEKVEILFNVNHTVNSALDDNDEDFDYQKEGGNEEDEQKLVSLKSKPDFEVNITKNGTTLSFTCQFLGSEPVAGEYDDVFGIQEITIHRGEHTDKDYACAGDILDGNLYDLLMNTLEKRGITQDFVSKISTLSTNYERALYIEFLESLKSFA